MDVILKVLEGAKRGTKISVKKDEFLIGRSQKCHLCAGSTSVSRHHCTITRKDAAVSIKDLGSRNGTLVNDQKIIEEVELSSGDQITIGTLKLLVTITHGITNLKRPKVTTVAAAVDRTVDRTIAAGDSSVGEEDITKWLLDAPSPPSASHLALETQTIRMDDTNAVQLQEEAEKQRQSEATSAGSSSLGQDEEKAPVEPSSEESPEVATKTKKKLSKKKGPGKLPPLPSKPGSKDSREAAMQALRNWNRRR